MSQAQDNFELFSKDTITIMGQHSIIYNVGLRSLYKISKNCFYRKIYSLYGQLLAEGEVERRKRRKYIYYLPIKLNIYYYPTGQIRRVVYYPQKKKEVHIVKKYDLDGKNDDNRTYKDEYPKYDYVKESYHYYELIMLQNKNEQFAPILWQY